MAEYAGYVASPPINYGQITDGLVSNIIAIDQAKREQERKTQEAFDKYYDDNVKTIKDFEYSKSPTFNSKVIPLADQYKKVIYNAKKTGSKQQVGLITSNAKTSINNINQAMKSISDNVGVIEKTTLEGKNSDMGNVYSDYYAEIVSPNNGEFTVLDDGTTAYTLYNNDGKIESTNRMFDPATLIKPTPFLDPKIDYEKNLTDWVASIGSVPDKDGRITTISPKLNPAFPNAKKTKIADLTSTPRNTARFLSSVAGYKGFKDEASRQKLIEDGVPEEKLIQVSLVNGIPQPILTDAQKKQAKLIAAQQIDQRVGIKMTEKSESGGLSGLGLFYEREAYKAQAAEQKSMKPLVSKAAIADKIYSSNDTSDWGPLKEAARLRGVKSPTITNTNEGYKILYGIPKGKRSPVEIARFNSAGEIYAYTTGKENVIDALGEYDRAKEYMSEMSPEPQQSQNTISLQEATANASKAGMTLPEYKAWLKTNRNIEVK
jgi:hypothetical protein